MPAGHIRSQARCSRPLPITHKSDVGGVAVNIAPDDIGARLAQCGIPCGAIRVTRRIAS